MTTFSYAAAYLDEQSQLLFSEFGLNGQLHMTLCFDSSGTITSENNIQLSKQKAIISKITHWNTIHGRYLVAELSNCDWSKDLNSHYHSIGAIEDLPHLPHITLLKEENTDLETSMRQLVGKEVYFDSFFIKTKSLSNKMQKHF